MYATPIANTWTKMRHNTLATHCITFCQLEINTKAYVLFLSHLNKVSEHHNPIRILTFRLGLIALIALFIHLGFAPVPFSHYSLMGSQSRFFNRQSCFLRSQCFYRLPSKA